MSHISFHSSFLSSSSLLLLLFQIHSNPLIFSKIENHIRPAIVYPSLPRKISLPRQKIRTYLPFISLYRRRTKYPNRSPQTITRNITKKTYSTNDVDSSRCSPSPSSCPRSIIPHFLVGPSQIRGSVVQEIAWP